VLSVGIYKDELVGACLLVGRVRSRERAAADAKQALLQLTGSIVHAVR
jgi:hypothetical protein